MEAYLQLSEMSSQYLALLLSRDQLQLESFHLRQAIEKLQEHNLKKHLVEQELRRQLRMLEYENMQLLLGANTLQRS